MIHNPVVGFVVCSDTFCSSLESRRVLMKVRHHTTAACAESCRTVVFATAAIGSVGNNSCGFVDTAATVLMLVAMLSSLARAREPFESELIFSDFHKDIYLVGPPGVEPGTGEL